MLSTLDRYILKYFTLYFFGTLALILVLIVVIDTLSLMTYNQVDLFTVLKYQIYGLPLWGYQMFPFICLFGTVLSLSYLNKENEIVAAMSLGVSIKRIERGIVGLVLLFSVFVFFAHNQLGHFFEQKRRYIYYVQIKNKPQLYSTTKKGRIWYRSKNTLFSVQSMNKEDSSLHGLTMYTFGSHWKLSQIITAKRVNVQGKKWHLLGGKIQHIGKGFEAFEETIMEMPEGSIDFSVGQKVAGTLPLGELGAFIKKNQNSGIDTTRYEVDYHARLGFAFAPLIMVLLGAPFSMRFSQDMLKGFAVSLFFAILYWLAYRSGLVLGRSGHISPLLAAWSTNGIVVFGFLLFGLGKMLKIHLVNYRI